jgi:GT2 family glycosyltransferase
MVTHNSNDVLGDSLATVLEIPGLRVLIVDNNSLEKPVANETSRVRVIANITNLGYAKAINIGLAEVETEYVVLLNPDAFLTYEVVAEAMESLRLNSKQLLAPDFFDATGSFLPSCREGYSLSRLVDDLIQDPRSYLRRVAEKTSRDVLDRDFLWLVGACVFSSKSFLLDIGGLDEDYFLYMEDVELGRRAKGKGLVRSLESSILHLGAQSTRNSATLKYSQLAEARLKYLRRHYGLWPWLLMKCVYIPLFRPINCRK